MDLKIWTKRYFDEDSVIEWPCPHCNNSSLKLIKDKLHHEETVSSKEMRSKNIDWEFEWIQLVFSGQLKCSNCSETVFFTGTGNPEHFGFYDDLLDEHIEQYTNSFTPTFFQPTIKLFNVSENCSEILKTEIENSFKLFWCDLPSCANKIRVSLEILMNEQGVKKYEVRGGKRIPISLHKRLEIYNHTEIKDLLLAIKWIGNTGSHIGDLQTIDILEAYRLLEYSLNKIYNDEYKELQKITKDINKRRGIRKRK